MKPLERTTAFVTVCCLVIIGLTSSRPAHAALCENNSSFVLQWGYPSGTRGGEIVSPVDVAFDSQGNAYVTDFETELVTVFDPAGNAVDKWGSPPDMPGLLDRLGEIEIFDDEVYLLTTSGIHVFDLQGGFVRSTGVRGTSFAMDGIGHIYAQGSFNAIARYDKFGALIDLTPFIFQAAALRLTVDPFGNLWGAKAGSVAELHKYDANLDRQFIRFLGLIFMGIPDTDVNGDVYVPEIANRRVRKLRNSDGGDLLTFGTAGFGPGFIHAGGGPGAVSIDPAGNIHVVDAGDGQIERFDSAHNYLDTYGIAFGPGSFGEQMPDVAVDELTGNVLVASIGRHSSERRVQVFDADGNFLMNVGKFGLDDGDLGRPTGVAVDSQGNIYVAHSRSTFTVGRFINKYDSSGNFVLRWGGTPGSGPGELMHVNSIDIDSQDMVYVADSGNDRVQVFDPSGVHQRDIGTSGTGSGELDFPDQVAVDDSGNVFISDDQLRIQKFDATGVFLAEWGVPGTGPGEFTDIGDLDVDVDGNVYATDVRSGRIQKFDNSGNFLREWGREGSGAGELLGPRGLAVTTGGALYVTDPGNSRVQLFGCALDVLEQLIQDLIDDGVLNGGQGNALLSKLEAALAQIDKDNTKAATNQLEALVNQVEAFINAGTLTPEEGQPLIDAANAAIAELN